MSRFNLHDNVWVEINFKNLNKKLTNDEITQKYVDLIKHGKILFDKKNTKRRALIIKGIENDFYLVSVIGDESFNSLHFYEISEDNVFSEITNINNIMSGEV